MSTYLYLECLDHDPPLVSADEVGQHLRDLPGVRRMLASRDHINAVAGEVTPDDYFTRHGWVFLRQHPKCRIRVVDEYGKEHPAEVAS